MSSNIQFNRANEEGLLSACALYDFCCWVDSGVVDSGVVDSGVVDRWCSGQVV